MVSCEKSGELKSCKDPYCRRFTNSKFCPSHMEHELYHSSDCFKTTTKATLDTGSAKTTAKSQSQIDSFFHTPPTSSSASSSAKKKKTIEVEVLSVTAQNVNINKTFTVEKHPQARRRTITTSSKKTTARLEDEEGFEEDEDEEVTKKSRDTSKARARDTKKTCLLRVSEHPDSLVYNGGKLQCIVCNYATVGAHKSHTTNHLNSVNHQQNLETKKVALDSEAKLRVVTKKYFKDTGANGFATDEDMIHFRLLTLKAFLGIGLSFAAIDAMRPYLERNSRKSLTSSTNMRQLLPILIEEEFHTVMKELEGRDYLVIFDGTTKVGEVFCIVFRWVNPKTLEIEQRLVHLGKYAKSFDHNELCAATMTALGKYQAHQGTFQKRGNVVGFQKDRCSVNTLASTFLCQCYVKSRDLGCFSHTLTHVGEHFMVVLLKKFKEDLCGLMSSSHYMRNHWAKSLEESFNRPGNTRWWATWEVYFFYIGRWDDCVLCVLTSSGDGRVPDDGARINRLRAILTNPVTCALLKFEMGIVVLVGKMFVSATYLAEGDGPTALVVYDLVNNINIRCTSHLQNMSFPGADVIVQAYAEALLDEQQRRAAGLQPPAVAQAGAAGAQPVQFADIQAAKAFAQEAARSILRPAINYFNKKFDQINGALADQMKFYKILRYANPFAVQRSIASTQLDVAAFRQTLVSLDWFTIAEIDDIVGDLPLYIEAVSTDRLMPVSEEDELEHIVIFWKANKSNFGAFKEVFVAYALTFVPSSAAAERVFSILKRFFGNNQNSALEDYIEYSVMLSFNKRAF